MRVVHSLVGYDPVTDRAKLRFDIDGRLLPAAKKIARVPADDPEAAWSYPLSKPQVGKLAKLIGVTVETDNSEFFLEAFADTSRVG